MPKGDEYIDAPQTLTGLFPNDTSSDDDNDDDNDDKNALCYETQTIVLVGQTLQVRQYDYHSHNANRVWPGTFNLAEYLLQTENCNKDNNSTADNKKNNIRYKYDWGNVLELGTATGLLAIRLCSASRIHHNQNTIVDENDDTASDYTKTTTLHDKQDTKNNNYDNNNKDEDTICSTSFCCNRIVTTDVQDEENDIQNNLQYNYQLNNICIPPIHVPHTWGTGWEKSILTLSEQQSTIQSTTENSNSNNNNNNTTNTNTNTIVPHYYDTIIASDILLYVNAYEALVTTIQELFALNDATKKSTTTTTATKFIMSWNRRMKESIEFFNRMKDAGFHCTHEGKCVYTFVYSDTVS